jgi:hypothetical protein
LELFAATFCVIALGMAVMATGLFFGRAPLQGTCSRACRIEGAACEGCPRQRDGIEPGDAGVD